jgi:hypothetical protein
VLNYYVNIEDFASCTIKVGDQDVAISWRWLHGNGQ